MIYRACVGAFVFSIAQVAAAQQWQRPQVDGTPRQSPAPRAFRQDSDQGQATNRSVACQPALTEREVAGLKISQEDYDDAYAQAENVARMIGDVVKNPHSGQTINLSEGFAMDRNAQDRASRFIKDNNLFNRYIADGETINPAMNQVRGSVDDFIVSLNQLKGLTGYKVKVLNFASKIPGSRFVIGANPISRVVTINQHIQQIGQTIDDGIGLMKDNIKELYDLHANTVVEIKAMEKEIVYMDILTKAVERVYYEDPEFQNNPELRDRLQFEVMRRLETYGVDQKGLMSVLIASTEGIQHQLSVHHGVIDNAVSLRRVAEPAIAITWAVRLAAQDATRVLGDQDRIRAEIVSSIKEMTGAIQKTNTQLLAMYNSSVLPAELLASEMEKIDVERKRYTTEMRKIYEKKKTESAKFDKVLKSGMRVLEGQSVGARMDLILGGDGTTQAPR